MQIYYLIGNYCFSEKFYVCFLKRYFLALGYPAILLHLILYSYLLNRLIVV